MSQMLPSTPAKPQTSFTSLPREIRDQIYGLTVVRFGKPFWRSDILDGSKPTMFRTALKQNNEEVRGAKTWKTYRLETGLCLLFTKASNAQIVAEARQMFFQKNDFVMNPSFASDVLNESRRIPEMRHIRKISWNVYLGDRFPSLFHQICSASAALRLQKLTVHIQGNDPLYTREDLDGIFREVVSGCEEAPAQTLGGKLRFEFSLNCAPGRFRHECGIEDVKRLSKGISKDELESLCVTNQSSDMIYFIGHTTTIYH